MKLLYNNFDNVLKRKLNQTETIDFTLYYKYTYINNTISLITFYINYILF